MGRALRYSKEGSGCQAIQNEKVLASKSDQAGKSEAECCVGKDHQHQDACHDDNGKSRRTVMGAVEHPRDDILSCQREYEARDAPDRTGEIGKDKQNRRCSAAALPHAPSTGSTIATKGAS